MMSHKLRFLDSV